MGEDCPEDNRRVIWLDEFCGELRGTQAQGGQVFRADTRRLEQAIAFGPDGGGRIYNRRVEGIGTVVDEGLEMVGVTRWRGCLRRFVELTSPAGIERGDKIVFEDRDGQRIRSAKVTKRPPRAISLGQGM